MDLSLQSEQCAGRANRMEPSPCYHVYFSAVNVQQFTKFCQPNVLRVLADAVVLHMQAIRIKHVNKCPFATIPRCEDLQSTERVFRDSSALNTAGRDASSGRHQTWSSAHYVTSQTSFEYISTGIPI